MRCPKCDDGELKLIETDSRQEWCKEYYECNSCGRTFILHTIYKTQSNLIESQELLDEDFNVVG